MAVLKAKNRKHIAKSNFALPGKKKYPIHDLSHARNALARSSGKPEEATVKSAVYKKWPSLKPGDSVKAASIVAQEMIRDLFVYKLADAGPEGAGKPDVQILRVGKFNHPKYGKFEITPKTLAEFKQNFDNKVRGIDIAFDYFHDSDKEASGWPTELYLTENGTELWAKVDWTPTASKKLTEREVRYFSPDFAFQWKDPESGVLYNNVLFGGGLTNRPFVKEMSAIVAAEERGNGMAKIATLKEIQDELAKLTTRLAEMSAAAPAADKEHDGEDEDDDKEDDGEDDDKEDDGDEEKSSLKKQLADHKKALAQYAEKHEKLAAEMAEMKKAKQMSEKIAAFNVMLSEGKVCAAQKEPFIKGDMVEFAKLAKAINLSERGHAGKTQEADSEDREDQVLKLAEAKREKNPKLSIIDSITLANKEIE